MAAGLPVRLAGAHPGAIEDVAGLLLRLSSPKAFPPGQPVEIAVIEPPLRLESRSIGSRRADGEGFELRVRLINLRKDTREALDRAFAARSGG